MTSHYTNLISIACLFLCLSIASARSSLIQQVTDGINTSQQSMQSSGEKGRPPSTYSIKNSDDSHIGVTPFPPNEVFEVNENPNSFTWTLKGFSKLREWEYTSAAFSVAGIKWNLRVFPHGNPRKKRLGLALYLVLNANLDPSSQGQVKVVAKLRVLNQRQSNTVERTLETSYRYQGDDGGFLDIVSQSDLRTKGFVVNDELRVQVEVMFIIM